MYVYVYIYLCTLHMKPTQWVYCHSCTHTHRHTHTCIFLPDLHLTFECDEQGPLLTFINHDGYGSIKISNHFQP